MTENHMGGYGAPSPEEPAAAGRDPRVLIGGGIGLAVVALAGGYLLLGGGGGGSAPTATPTVIHHVTPTPTATVVPLGKPTPLVHSFHGDVGRDPFRALITPPPVATTTAPKPTATTPVGTVTTPGNVVGPTGSVPTGSVPTGTVPTGLPTVLPTVTTPSPATPTTTPPPAVLVVLKAIAFHGTVPYVVVTFSGKSYALKTGDTAGTDLKVVAIAPDDGTATFQLGDQTFDLHIGQSYVD
jgi:hypothetical protein